MHVPSPSAEKDRARTAARRRASPRRAAGQLTDATRDGHDRVTRVDYGNGEVETFAYDKWGRLAAHARGRLRETYAYDHFGRLVEKEENGTVFAYAYDAWGRRTRRGGS